MANSILEGEVKIINLSLGDRSYPIYIAPGLIGRAGELLRVSLPKAHRCIVVTSEVVWKLHGASLARSLGEASVQAETILVPEGEEAKTWREAERLLGELVDLGLDRQSLIVAFGGGAVGDLAGFVASIYLRGIRLVQVPTTLLSQVDSSIGGKVAVNHPMGKNLVGAFHQPSLVVSDPGLLRTLPREEIASGLAEAAKYGVISDVELFGILEAKTEEIVGLDMTILTEVIARCCAIKARLVEVDEKDAKGVRAALNYGHTVGHALELLTEMRMRHGEAVAIGMTVAARISESLGLFTKSDAVRQRTLLRRLGLSVGLPDLDASEVLEAMRRDKKAEGGSIRFVLPTGIGRPPILRSVQDSLIVQALEVHGDG